MVRNLKKNSTRGRSTQNRVSTDNLNCQNRIRVQVKNDLKTDAQGNLEFLVNGTNIRGLSDIAKQYDFVYQEFKPLGLNIKITLDQQLSVSNEFSWSSLRAYHFQVGTSKPNHIECLPQKHLHGSPSVVHIFGGYTRRFYGSIGTIEGGLLIKANDLPKGKKIGVINIDFSLSVR